MIDHSVAAGDPIAYAAHRQAIAAAYERAQFAEEEAGYAGMVGEDDAAEYWHQEADRAERRARRLERGGA